jgi:23S rRNA (cytidine1920-2'-O)/16S rRNA (cytidine1409-2'-O)-methyltransferase
VKSKATLRGGDSQSIKTTIKPGSTRLDVLLVKRGLAPSRERAQAMLMAGHVRANGATLNKPGSKVSDDAEIEIVGEPQRYASRGGMKLEGAIEDFRVEPKGKVCLDVGSSTGGFTDCLLQHGAERVYAVDVTISQLEWKLQKDARVKTVECNARYLKPDNVGEPVELITMDLSFISVAKVLPSITPLATPGAEFLILVKPQFELEKREVGKGGIVRDPLLREKAVRGVVAAAENAGLEVLGVKPSRLPGAEGNQEYFLHARWRG